MENYEKDTNGYVKIRFTKPVQNIKIAPKQKRVMPCTTTTMSSSSEDSVVEVAKPESSPWYVLAGVDVEFAKKVDGKKVTKELLLSTSITDVLRGAFYNEYLAQELEKHLSLRPLPIRTFFPGKKEKIVLFPHQQRTIEFMRQRESIVHHGICGGIIRLEMGLGKTLLAIVHSLTSPRKACSERYGGRGFPTLIIASKTIISEWKKNGFDLFFDSNNIKVLYLHKKFLGDERLENIDREAIVKYDFVITTYDVCSIVCRKGNYHEEFTEAESTHSLLRDGSTKLHNRARFQSDRPNVKGADIIYTTPWERVFLDESQRIANPKTWTYKYIMAVYGRYKWCLTGTPIKNNKTDIFSQFRFCGYDGVVKKKEWDRNYKYYITKDKLKEALINMEYQDTSIVLPEKYENAIVIELQGMEKACYDFVNKKAMEMYDDVIAGICNFTNVFAMFTKLRQCCVAPYLITAESKREKGTKATIRYEKESIKFILNDLSENDLGGWVHNKDGEAGIFSSKITEILKVLTSIPVDEKVLVFSSFTSVLDLLAYACKKRLGDTFVLEQMDGDTDMKEREDILKRFRDQADLRSIFMTYKVGSEGLNLIEANHVICIEPWWSPCVSQQAIRRCYRTSQKKCVYVHNIFIKDSIEERVMKVCKLKELLTKEILDGGSGGDGKETSLDKATMGKILGFYDDD